jgi:hypothetical protein
MATFFNNIDAIYCLCIEERKTFVTEQFTNLGIIDKVKIFDAHTRNSPSVHKAIAEHLVYPIYTDNLISVACTLGIRDIMLDVVNNKYNYAMVIEDDVIFLESKFTYGNNWINRTIINKYINILNPYVFYLQSSANEKIYYDSNTSEGGIVMAKIRYGEPAYITNHIACSILLKHLFPITSPFDEYKFLIKKRYAFQEAILVPYICCELSANHSNYDMALVNHTFTRNFLSGKKSAFEILSQQNFYVVTNRFSGCDKLLLYLLSLINPNIKIILNEPTVWNRTMGPPVINPMLVKADTNKSNNTMSYCIGSYVTSLDDMYVIGSTVERNTKCSNGRSFIISVRGLNSLNIVKKKFGVSPLVGDIFLLFSKFLPKVTNTKYKFCFIYEGIDLRVMSIYPCIFLNPTKVSANVLINEICSSQYVVSNDINYITVGNSYGIPGVFATLTRNINKYYYTIARDYYSNITDANILPIVIGCNCRINIIKIDDIFNQEAIKFIQPNFSKNDEIINNLLDVVPFTLNLHKSLRGGKRYTQIFI